MRYGHVLAVLILLLACSMAFGQTFPQSGTMPGFAGSAQSAGHGMRATQATGAFIPATLSYQGLLTTAAGTPVQDGAYTLQFDLANALSSGTILWTETQSAVTVQRGTFSVLLGSVSPLTAIFNQPLWLQVTATAGPGISSPILFGPRTALASAAYALGPWQYETGPFASGYTMDGTKVIKYDTTWTGIYASSKGTSSTSGFWTNKATANGRNYLVLQTGGADRWSVGTMYNDDLSIYYWPGGRTVLSAMTTGNVGINTNAPTTGFDVNAATHLRDTLNIGSPALSGVLDVYSNKSTRNLIHMGTYSSVGGAISLFDTSHNYTIRLEPDGNGSGGWFWIGRNAGWTGFNVDGNYAGSFNPRVSISGVSRSVSFNMDQTADASVDLPDSSISAHEILDEPGLARTTSAGSISIARSGITNLTSASITVPAAGYVVAFAMNYFAVYGDTIGNILAYFATTPTGGITQEYFAFGSQNERLAATTYRWGTGAIEHVYPVASAGTYTYYLNAYRGLTGGNAVVTGPRMMLMYFPTAYGPVASMVSSAEASSFSSAQLVAPSADPATSNATVQPAYSVDLRELELRATKARLEAEKAERELLEARMARKTLENDNQPQQ